MGVGLGVVVGGGDGEIFQDRILELMSGHDAVQEVGLMLEVMYDVFLLVGEIPWVELCCQRR